MTSPSPMAYRRSLEDRLRAAAAESGRELGWVRRRHVFIRVLHRLTASRPDDWVLKGGFAVELRRPGFARATIDLDLAVRRRTSTSGDVALARESLVDALGVDVDGDQFLFLVGPGRPLAEDANGRPAWRFSIDAQLAGKSFVTFRLDLVERPEELVDLTTLTLPVGTAAPHGATPRYIVTTALRQQCAEKLHALTRSYATGESTRVKDLVDVVLLVDDGLVGDERLYAVVRRVFTVRGTSSVPTEIGPPPVGWGEPFRTLAASAGLTGVTAAEAGRIVTDLWLQACQAAEGKDS